MKIEFVEYAMPKGGVVVAGVLDDKVLSPGAAELDRRTGGAITRALKSGVSRAAAATGSISSAPATAATSASSSSGSARPRSATR